MWRLKYDDIKCSVNRLNNKKACNRHCMLDTIWLLFYFSTRFFTVDLGIVNLTIGFCFNSSIAAKPAMIGSAMYIQRRMLLARFSIIASTKRTIAHIIEFLVIEFMLMPP
jgi:hypothetical protein